MNKPKPSLDEQINFLELYRWEPFVHSHDKEIVSAILENLIALRFLEQANRRSKTYELTWGRVVAIAASGFLVGAALVIISIFFV